MTDLAIRKYPDPALRKKALKVEKVTNLETKLLSQMAELMYLSQGVGLAANQVGIDKQLAVVDVGNGLIRLINPTIIQREGAESHEEWCLSVPETCVMVKRAKKIAVSYLNEDGNISQLRADGLLSRAIQHEMDHLRGRLIIDYLNPIKRLFLKKTCARF